ncbi:MAG TPA: DUF5069 domain-containing protein [Nitrospiria bacterium]|nr:DUF5069 domain-containing protein [Nitrospiria bacterium]
MRSPREALGGFILLPRLIDKVRLHAREELPPEYVGNLLKPGRTLDGWFLSFTETDGEGLKAAILAARTDEEVLAWIEENGRSRSAEEKKAWAAWLEKYRPDPDSLRRRKELYPELATRADLSFLNPLDLIDMDEGRIPVRQVLLRTGLAPRAPLPNREGQPKL